MRIFILIAFISLLFSSCSNGQNSNNNQENDKNVLTAQEFSEKLQKQESPQLVDVRTPDEYSKGHLKNALNYDWNGDNFESQIQNLDKSKPVYVYCLSGRRSAAAAEKMRSEGFTKVYELEGGIMSWRASNLPEVTGESGPAGLTRSQFDSLTSGSKPVLVDFYADWCMPCKVMKPYLDEIANENKDKMVLLRIDADNNMQLSKELKIEALPTLQFYKDNKMVWQEVGLLSKEDILKKMNL